VQAAAAPVVGIQGGRVTLPDGNPNDGESAIDVAAGVFKTPTSLTLNEVPVNEAPSVGGFPQPLAVYSLDAQPSFAGSVRISVIYPDFVPAVSNWVFSGTPVQKNQLSLAGWDGFSWRRLGGKVDQNLNTITGLTNDFHYVGVFEMGGASPLDDRPMEKIITPNGDTVNDSARFSSIDPGTKIEIFDINGHRVRTITTDLTHNEWNGQDDSGKIVESGVYIYQYSENGQRVSGVIAVAK
jgi:gliding motility-associated-like protein